MKRFLIHISGIIVATYLLMFAPDFLYTSVYMKSAPRTSFQLFRIHQNTKVNYIFIGSSRVRNHIVPSLIMQMTGKTALNAGIDGWKMADILTMVKLTNEYNIRADTIFIQLDYSYNLLEHARMSQFTLAPFAKENAVLEQHFSELGQSRYVNLPFLRYMETDRKNGMREVMLNLMGKKTTAVVDGGFEENTGPERFDEKNVFPEKIVHNNPIIRKIDSICLAHNLKPVYFCAPIWHNTEGIEYIGKLKKEMPDMLDFSNRIQERALFRNNLHLNKKGAEIFTLLFINEVLTNRRNVRQEEPALYSR